MRQASAKVWIGGTAFLSVLLLAAAWFLLVDPVVARASDDTASADAQRDQNDLLEMEIARLEEQFTHLAEYQAELDALRLQMPVTGDGASISRELQSLADSAGVTILNVAPSVPTSFVSSAPEAAVATEPTEEAAEGDADATGEDAAISDSAVPATDGTVRGFYSVPITLTSLGTYDASVAFLRSVQQDASRLYLVSSIQATTQEAAGATGGRPATSPGDIELVMTGYAFVLVDSAATPVDPTEVAEETVPVPGAEANPFVPGR
jgi:hypothetical protein